MPRYRQGLPDVLLGVWAGADGIERLAAGLREGLQEERDRRVLQGAVTAFCRGREPACSPVVVQLLERGVLAPEPATRFDRFAVIDGKVQRAAGAATAIPPFPSARLVYLAPPITENDRRYRALGEADPETLESDRYRLASAIVDGTLWIATAARDLQPFLGGTSPPVKTLAESPVFAAASAGWTPTSRGWAFVELERLTALALRSGEPRLEDAARSHLLDLRNHSALALELTPLPDGRRLRLSGRLVRWTAVAQP
jgi:hypothetical protein